MMYDKFVRDFADRTRKNLDFIEANQPDFEITQLVNSCLGLITFPRQVCFDNIPETPLNKLDSEGLLFSVPWLLGTFPR